MPTDKAKTEKISMDKAIHRIHGMCVNNAERVIKLEEQYNQMLKGITQKHEEIETRIVNIQSQTNEMHMKTTSTVEENKQKFDEIKQQCNEIMRTLYCLTNKEKLEPQKQLESQQQLDSQNIQVVQETTNNHLTFTHQALNIDDHPSYTNKNALSLPINDVKTPKSHTIMIPSPTAIPTFFGKNSESPNQFLIRVQAYAETVYGWDRPTLLLGISQFLRGTALDWYCQISVSHRRPQIWTDFASLFLSQFNSPIRIARQKKEWYECKQWKNENINEFLIRLRALWSELRPNETEADFIRHLQCKMRNDLFTMMGVSHGASLDEIILAAQKVEEILYRRNKEQYVADYYKRSSFENNTLDIHKHYNDSHIDHYDSTEFSNSEHSSNEGNASHQQKKYDTKRQWNNDATPNYHSKNGHGALGRRDADAHS